MAAERASSSRSQICARWRRPTARPRGRGAGSASSSRGPFDLAGDVLLRAALDPHRLRYGSAAHRCFTTSPPTTRRPRSCSASSTSAYRALESGASPELPELAIQYADYAVRQRARMLGPRALHELLGYWTEQLAGAPPHAGAARRPTDGRACRATAARVLEFELPATLAGGPAATIASPRGLAVRHPAGCLRHPDRALHRGARTRRSGRTGLRSPRRGDACTLLGCLHQHPADAQRRSRAIRRFAELLGRVKLTTLEAQIHQELPFEKLVEALNPVRDAEPLAGLPDPLRLRRRLRLGPDAGRRSRADAARSRVGVRLRFDLSLIMREQRDGSLHRPSSSTPRDLFDRGDDASGSSATTRRCSRRSRAIRGSAVAPSASSAPPSAQTLLVDWNRDRACRYERRGLHELIGAQVARHSGSRGRRLGPTDRLHLRGARAPLQPARARAGELRRQARACVVGICVERVRSR